MSAAASFVHRQIWPWLPREWRRQGLFAATAWSAPRPAPTNRPALPIFVAGAFRTASGLGQSARLCFDALRACGHPARAIDLTDALMQPADTSWSTPREGEPRDAPSRGDEVADDGPGTLILHVNSPLVPLAMLHLGRRFVRHKRVVGYWAWELPDVPADWRHGLPFVHEVWVPSRFTGEALRAIAGGRPIRVLPHPVALGSARADEERYARPGLIPDRPFTVLSISNAASSVARKNPMAAIEAFRRAFGDDPAVRLVVKTTNASSVHADRMLASYAASASNITVVDDVLGADDLAQLYAGADVLISLHRSEGFGLTLAEAMLRGLPVIATDWSGNTDFLTPGNGIPVPCRLVPALDPQGTYHYPRSRWAEPDIAAATAALIRLRQRPELRQSLGEAAARFARTAWNAQTYADAVQAQLGLTWDRR